jgi:hypothetical protein
MQNKRDLILEKVDLLVAELMELRTRGPHFRICHRFHKPGTVCAPGEEILAVCLVHRGQEYSLRLSLALRILFDYLARHSRFAQSATQIEVGIRADRFYTNHAELTFGTNAPIRRIPRSYVRVYMERLRLALEGASCEANLMIERRAVLVSERTVTNEVGYRLRARIEWIHTDG